MKSLVQRQLPLAALTLIACFGVFVLPNLLPPAPLQGVSAANQAMFNNKVAAMAGALASLLTLLYFLLRPGVVQHVGHQAKENCPLPATLAWAAVAIICIPMAIITVVLAHSRVTFPSDLDYFVHQMGEHTRFGRVLYDGIEFPYGPLLFYLPILIQKLLFFLHLSLRGAFLVTLNGIYVTGLLMLVYVLNALPMRRPWKIFAFVAIAIQSFQFNFGLNYTLFRFLVVFACLTFASRRRRIWPIAFSFAAGEVLCLATSPEMGFAFLTGSLAYGAYRFYGDRSAKMLPLLLAPPLATLLFFAGSASLLGWGYLRMLALFSRGVLNFPVEPIPYILVFLFAMAGLAPWGLARYFRERSAAAPLLAGTYIASLALLPVAFGRCDPDHVLLNGLGLYLLSFVGISLVQSRQKRVLWALAVASMYLFSLRFTMLGYKDLFQDNMASGLQHTPMLQGLSRTPAQNAPHPSAKRVGTPADGATLDISKLKQITGGEPVITPVETSRFVQDRLYQAGLLLPTFYYFQMAVLDHQAELREIQELNQAHWALIDPTVPIYVVELPETMPFGRIQFKYPAKRPTYIEGVLFEKNLAANWEEVATLSGYKLYRKR